MSATTSIGPESRSRKTARRQDDGINNVRDPHSNEVDLSKITDLNARAMAELADLDDRIHTHCMGLSVSHGLMCNNLKILSIGWKAYEVGEIQRITYDEVLMGSPCRVRTTTTGPEKCTTGSEPACTSTIPLQGRSDRPKRKLPHDFPPSPLTDSQSSSKRRSDANDHRTTLAATVPTAPICGTTIPVWSDVNDTLDGASSTDSLDGKTNSSDVPFPTFDFCDPSSYITVSGHRLSKPARDEVTRSVNLLRSLKPQEDGYVLKRRVRRVGMEVLRRWEIFALDTQQI
ncbi:hypothetical protein KEM52_006661 [Ascosphaera acerosa]|nr:hypothetical protein KEM52_006661 [Ascosphaera acerosa]